MAAKILLNLLFLLLIITGGHSDVYFFFDSQCTETVWLASRPSDGDLNPTLEAGNLEIFLMPDPWSGSIWFRTGCTTNATGYFSCETGDCGTGTLECQGPPPGLPVTLLNFYVLNNVVAYEVSLIHGGNIRVKIEPNGGLLEDGSGKCPAVDCAQDLSVVCPPPLVAHHKNGANRGCYSACDVFKDPKYCCTQNCQPNEYTQIFKNQCGSAHTYPGDSPPMYRCKRAVRYDITLCPVL